MTAQVHKFPRKVRKAAPAITHVVLDPDLKRAFDAARGLLSEVNRVMSGMSTPASAITGAAKKLDALAMHLPSIAAGLRAHGGN